MLKNPVIKLKLRQLKKTHKFIKFFNNNIEIKVNSFYNLNDGSIFTFYSDELIDEYEFNYYIYQVGITLLNTCSIKIIISCSSSFLNCNECEYIEGKGSNENYPLTYDNGIIKYYKKESRPDGYYLNSNNKFDECHEGYKKCYGSTNNNCLNNESKWLLFNSNNKFEKFNFKQYNEYSDLSSTKCLTCDTDNNYYKDPTSLSSPYNCILITTQINHYFFNIDNFY